MAIPNHLKRAERFRARKTAAAVQPVKAAKVPMHELLKAVADDSLFEKVCKELAGMDAEARVELRKQGAAEVVSGGMATRRDKPAVQKAGCRALWALLCSEPLPRDLNPHSPLPEGGGGRTAALSLEEGARRAQAEAAAHSVPAGYTTRDNPEWQAS